MDGSSRGFTRAQTGQRARRSGCHASASSNSVRRIHSGWRWQPLATVVLVLSVWAVGIVRACAADNAPVTFEVRAAGVQIYDCRVDASGQLSWQFREPLATLIRDGKTVGRHFAGPIWQMEDGSEIVGKVKAQSPGATPKDISLLKLDVLNHQGDGVLSKVTSVERVATVGGVFAGGCPHAGDLHVEPYRAVYHFISELDQR